MLLAEHTDGESGDPARPLRIEGVENDRRPQGAKGNRKEGCGLLAVKRLFDVRMAAVDMDLLTGKIGRGEKRETLDVVPVEV
jgi:hypothetical protein